MEALGLLKRERSKDDERRVEVSLSEAGRSMKAQAAPIPLELFKGLVPEIFTAAETQQLKNLLKRLIDHLGI
jgi:DNA-binding MarR family transcriptional regulator